MTDGWEPWNTTFGLHPDTNESIHLLNSQSISRDLELSLPSLGLNNPGFFFFFFFFSFFFMAR